MCIFGHPKVKNGSESSKHNMLKLVKHVILLFLKLRLERILDKMVLLDRNTT